MRRWTRSCESRVASSAPTRQRLDPEVFRLPVERIRAGYYTDAYFNFTRELLRELGHRPAVTMQVFQKQHSVLGGIDEAIAVLKLCSDDFSHTTGLLVPVDAGVAAAFLR